MKAFAGFKSGRNQRGCDDREKEDRMKRRIKDKTIAELKENLAAVENDIKKGRKVKRRTKKELALKKQKYQQALTHMQNKGLDGLVNTPRQEAIPVSEDHGNSLADLTGEPAEDTDKEASIDKMKGLTDILES